MAVSGSRKKVWRNGEGVARDAARGDGDGRGAPPRGLPILGNRHDRSMRIARRPRPWSVGRVTATSAGPARQPEGRG